METFFRKHKCKHIYLFTDCVFTKGYTRTSIIDISRKRIFFIPNSYYELSSHFRSNNIKEILEMLDGNESRIEFYKFMNFLLKERIASLVNDIKRFPEMKAYWDHPSPITNAIIDIRSQYDYLLKAINELAELRCEYLQIRFYETTNIKTIEYIAHHIKDKCFKDVEILVKNDGSQFPKGSLLSICEKQKNIRFLIHSVPIETPYRRGKFIQYTSQQITSCTNCGIINQQTMRIPSIQGFMENKLYNSCLNRKIAIDENGEIGNCPSMKNKYGNIRNHSLKNIISRPGFKKSGMINKDQIEGCRDCEFRYVCSDCRAYTLDGKNYSKPAKCQYDPYSGVWIEKMN